jgi:hypothetical protein
MVLCRFALGYAVGDTLIRCYKVRETVDMIAMIERNHETKGNDFYEGLKRDLAEHCAANKACDKRADLELELEGAEIEGMVGKI